jgi:hypothetical protein
MSKEDAAQKVIDLHHEIRRLEGGSGHGTELYHLLDSLLEWADLHEVDFDAILSELRADYARTGGRS